MNSSADRKKCYSCGKIFKLVTDLERHKNRKTPCLIREIAPGDISNPLRCIYCNRIMSRASTLKKHLLTCKVKNGGMDILAEKVYNDERIAALENEVRQLREVINSRAAISGSNNINCCNTNSNNTIVFNNYNAPRVDTIKITTDDIASSQSISKMLFEKVYSNKELPENHVLYLPNVREHRYMVYCDGVWKNVIGDEADAVMNEIKLVIGRFGNEKLSDRGDIYHSAESFERLPGAVKESIIRYNTYNDRLTNKGIRESMFGARNMIKDTLVQQKII